MFRKTQLVLLLLLGTGGVFAQQVITGTVTDGTSPLPGVSVLEKGTNRGTQTDLDGNYSFSVPEGAVLQFVFLGFETQEVTVGNQTVINVTLERDAEQLAEVIVHGPLGITQEYPSIGYAVSSVNGEQLP